MTTSPGLLDAIRATGGVEGAGLKPTESNPAPPPPPPGDSRGGLLDAIRKAGGKEGAGLKSIKERKAEERKRRGEEEAAPAPSGGGGGDLMGDLMSKLTMRRKGISGGKPPPTSDEVKVEIQEDRECNDNYKHHITFDTVLD